MVCQKAKSYSILRIAVLLLLAVLVSSHGQAQSTAFLPLFSSSSSSSDSLNCSQSVIPVLSKSVIRNLAKVGLTLALVGGGMLVHVQKAVADSFVIDVSERKGYLYNDQGELTHWFKVGVPQPGAKIAYGTHRVHDKQVYPDWVTPQSFRDRGYKDIYRGSPEKPSQLGERWMRLVGAVGMHGTLDQESVGTEVSAGCFRFKSKAVVFLYDRMDEGDLVTIRQ